MPSNQAENMSAQETDDGVVNLSSEYYPILSLRSLLYKVMYQLLCPIYDPSMKHTGHKSGQKKGGLLIRRWIKKSRKYYVFNQGLQNKRFLFKLNSS